MQIQSISLVMIDKLTTKPSGRYSKKRGDHREQNF